MKGGRLFYSWMCPSFIIGRVNQKHSRKMLSPDKIKKLAPAKNFLCKVNFYSKIQIFAIGFFKILKNNAFRSIFLISVISKTAKNWHFCQIFSFYPILDYHEIKTWISFENPNGKSLDLHLIM